MSTYEIEAGVPLPAPQAKYPFAIMDVEDSFFVPYDGVPENVVIKRLRGACNWAQNKYERKFIVRRVDEGVRVWRKA